MRSLVCPYCHSTLNSSLLDFLPWLKLTRERFVCNRCSRISLFSAFATKRATWAGLALIVVVALTLRVWVGAAPSGHRPLTTQTMLIGLAVFAILQQLVSAFTLRHFATLVATEPGEL